MVLGTQWYILFNVIAGASAIRTSCATPATNCGVQGWLWWRKVALPAVFPYYVTGAITASGGSWNASIVAEVRDLGRHNAAARRLGAYIAQATEAGDFHRIVLGIARDERCSSCCSTASFWRPLYRSPNADSVSTEEATVDMDRRLPLLEVHGVRRPFRKPRRRRARWCSTASTCAGRGRDRRAARHARARASRRCCASSPGCARPTAATSAIWASRSPGRPPGVAMVFQSFALFPWLTVLQNVELGLEALGVPRRRDPRSARSRRST